METSLGRLQRQVDELSKKNLKLQDSLAHQKEEKNRVRTQFNKYKREVEGRIEKAVENAIIKQAKDFEKIIAKKDQKIQELEQKLNNISKN